MKVFLAGPIDYWWNENWGTPAHIAYKYWRDDVNKALIEAGHLVYRPHEAIKGAWDESMQEVNNTALRICDVVVYLTPPNVPAYGTAAECEYARNIGKEVLWAPPNDFSSIKHLTKRLDNPYGDVARKSYTKCEHPADKVQSVRRIVGRKMQIDNYCSACKTRFVDRP